MNLFVDVVVCFIILLVVVGSRFNTWPSERSRLFDGKPADYIDAGRYRGFCFLYILTFFVISAVLYSFPEFLKLIPGMEADFVPVSYTMCAILVVSLLAQHNLAAYDEKWRKQLHEWARIPRYVEEISSEILLQDLYTPVEEYRAQLKKELLRDDPAYASWEQVIARIEIEKANHTIEWSYLKCASLMLILRDICGSQFSESIKMKASRIEELRRLVSLTKPADKQYMSYKTELEEMSRYFIENICKYLIKKYPRMDLQYSAFKNLGFTIRQHDNANVSVRDAIILCSMGVAAVSVLSVVMLLLILDARSDREFWTLEKFFGWSLGSIECLMIAIFVGLLVKRMSSSTGRIGISKYLMVFLFSTLASFVFFQFAQDLNQQSANLPYARFLLAMSFSSLSVVVLSALSSTNLERQDVIVSSLFYGFVLGVVMAMFQIFTSLAFSWERYVFPETVAEFFLKDESKMILLGLVGFFKGFALGGSVSYFIQDTQRKQLMETLRQNPRIDRVMFMSCQADGKAFNVSTKDISKNGLKLQTRRELSQGSTIVMESHMFGRVEGVIRWTRKLFWGRKQIGVQLTSPGPRFNQFLRERYGEYYA